MSKNVTARICNRRVAEYFVYGANNIFNADLGLNQVAVGTKCFAAFPLIFAAKGGHHDNFNVFRLGGGTQDIKHIEAADFWHHYVAYD